MKYGFIGTGNMASAIIRGMCIGDTFENSDILGFNRTVSKAEKLAEECGITVCASLEEVMKKSDVVVMAVKPQQFKNIIPGMKENLREGQLIISIAAGKDIKYLQNELGENTHVARVMPSVASQVLMSTSCYACSENTTKDEIETIEKMFGKVGSIIEVEEELFGVFSAVGCASPAFTYMYIDALARGGVKGGMSKKKAIEVAANSVMGAAKMVLELNKHPYDLVDEVCSPAGTTIEGVCTLHERGFVDAAEKAVTAVIEKDNKMK